MSKNTSSVTQEWCENFIKSLFRKHFKGWPPERRRNAGFATWVFWDLAENSGLWKRGTYGTPMSMALERLCVIDHVCDDDGKYIYSVFRLKPEVLS